MNERDWGQFHTPKNLTMALSIEVAELMEHFQWLTPEESLHLPPETMSKVRHEVGDVMVYLLRLCDVLGIDPVEAASEKMIQNGRKYPVEKARGNARKYTDL